jgi:tetratricopeptide (TPR) repeat protein
MLAGITGFWQHSYARGTGHACATAGQTMSGEGSREVRYTAFLSYSHKDAAAAGRLHRRLENYRMPRRLVRGEGARGPIPDRLSPIFRDREELPAATDLSETVRAALAQSGALIILCSPAAAASLWVAEEIETFRRLHPDRPILAAVLDGDPPECFPAALRAFGRDGTWHEPLATDLRPHRDGARLGLLKLVAGITGVGLDALVQRDAARRVRRVMAVTMGAVAMMLVMAALTVVAVKARGEAERQRADAERMAGFMLTDLHDRLKGVGRLDIMRAVYENAREHYDRQIARGDRSTQTMLRRAQVLQGLGEEDVLQGGDNLRPALARFLEARRITTAQLAAAPNDPQRLFAAAQSEFWIGRVYYLREDWDVARRQYQLYAGAAERLIAAAPSNPDYMMERGYAAVNLGDVSSNSDPIGAEAQFLRSIRWFEAASHARPTDRTARMEMANAFGFLADSYWRRHLWPQALAARQRQVAILKPLHIASPDRVDIYFSLATGQNGLARALGQIGNGDQSLALLGETLVAAHRLTLLDPNNGEWLVFRTIVQCELLLGPRPPPGMSRSELVVEFQEGMAALLAQANPRRSQFAVCAHVAH